MFRRVLHLSALTAAFGLASNEAWAGKYDLDLTRLGVTDAGMVDPDHQAFRSLSSELGVLIAPKPVDPADSLGLSGFAIATDFSFNTIGSDKDYWKKTVNSSQGASNVVPSLQVLGRKGLWPGIEVGGGATHVFDSSMWAMAGYAKASLHEGFHHLPIPSIAVRGSFSRLLGATHFNMTTAALDVSASHVFGLGRTFNLTPYLGYQALFIMSRSAVLDATPRCDEADPADADDCMDVPAGTDSEFVFQKQDAIVRHRPFVGLRFIFSIIRVTAEAMFAAAGRSKADVDGDTVQDKAVFQQQYTISVGLDF